MDSRAYNEAKKIEVLQNISIDNLDDFIPIIKAIENSYLINPDHSELELSIRVILNSVLEKDLPVGIQLIHNIIDLFPKIKDIVHLPVNLIKTENDVNVIRGYIESLNHNYQIEAKLYFYRAIPDKFLNKEYACEFVDLQKISSVSIFHGAGRFLK